MGKVICGESLCRCGCRVVGLKGATGATGARGATGATGASDRILMGETMTLPTGEDAKVFDTGGGTEHVINFGIPRGEKGDKGDADTLEIGVVETLEPEQNARVVDVGMAGHHVLNIGIPRGVTGARGTVDFIPSAYMVKFNLGVASTGLEVVSGGRIPLERKELDGSGLVTLNADSTMQFRKTGIYKVDFRVNAFAEYVGQAFSEEQDIIAVGFRRVDDAVVYVGEAVYNYEAERVGQIVASGTFIVNSTDDRHELVNLGKSSLWLKSPAQKDTLSTSYFLVPLATLTVVYLGERD